MTNQIEDLVKSQLNGYINKIESIEEIRPIRDYFVTDIRKYISKIIKLANNVATEKFDEKVSLILKELSNEVVNNGEKVVQRLHSKAIIKKIKTTFRLIVGPWAYKSLIMKRGFEKPRGYPGDYKLLELIYNQKAISPGFGRYFDIYFLNNPYAEAVRRRKDKTAELLFQAINNRKSSTMNVLNLASGSCREIKDILSSRKLTYKGMLNFNLLDYDEEALNFSKQALDTFKQHNINFYYFKENILKLSRNKSHYEKVLGKQDLIYSIGLIDYFPDKILKEMVIFCLDLLAKEGKLILTIKDKDRDPFAPLPPGWFCDWNFVSRNEQDIIRLLNSLSRNIRIKSEIDKSGKIVFLEIVNNV